MGIEDCTDCGYSYGSLRREEIAPELRALAARYGDVLGGTDEGVLRARPGAGVWSVLEYGCHIRDVLAVQRGRILQAVAEVRPDFAPMRRDERAVEERYNDQQPAVVAGEITAAAGALADIFDTLDDESWSRTGIYHWPTTAVRTVDWIGRHTVHESVHHLADIGRQLAAGTTQNVTTTKGRPR